MSVASAILDSAMDTLIASNGDSLTFRTAPVLALVDRTPGWATPVPATFIEIKDSIAIPVAGEQFSDTNYANDVEYIVFRAKQVHGWYRCECYVFQDHPVENVTIDGNTYLALVLQSTEGNDAMLGGFTNQNFNRVALNRIEINTFNNMPVEGDAVTFRTASYRVMRVQRDDAAAVVIVDFGPTTSKQQS